MLLSAWVVRAGAFLKKEVCEMRHIYEWANRTYMRRCRICGKEFTCHSARRRYCGSAECEAARAERRNAAYVRRRAALKKFISSQGS